MFSLRCHLAIKKKICEQFGYKSLEFRRGWTEYINLAVIRVWCRPWMLHEVLTLGGRSYVVTLDSEVKTTKNWTWSTPMVRDGEESEKEVDEKCQQVRRWGWNTWSQGMKVFQGGEIKCNEFWCHIIDFQKKVRDKILIGVCSREKYIN